MVDHGCDIKYWSATREPIEGFIFELYPYADMAPRGKSHDVDFAIIIVEEIRIFWLTLPKSVAWPRTTESIAEEVPLRWSDPESFSWALGLPFESEWVGAEIPVWDNTDEPCTHCNVYVDGKFLEMPWDDPNLFEIKLREGFHTEAFVKDVLRITNRKIELVRVSSSSNSSHGFEVRSRQVFDDLNRARTRRPYSFDIGEYCEQRGLEKASYLLGLLNPELLNPILEAGASELAHAFRKGHGPAFDETDCEVKSARMRLDTRIGKYTAEFELNVRESVSEEGLAIAVAAIYRLGFEQLMKLNVPAPPSYHLSALEGFSGSWRSETRERFLLRSSRASNQDFFLNPVAVDHPDWWILWDYPSEVSILVTRWEKDLSFGTFVPSTKINHLETSVNWQKTALDQISPKHYLLRLRLQGEENAGHVWGS